jgi:parallel beta-helix repeat protein
MYRSTRENRRRLKPAVTMIAVLGLAASVQAMTAPLAEAAPHHTLQVEPGVGTITAAIARAKAGDTLVLAAGTFFDNALVTVPLHITGAGSAKTVIRPPEDAQGPCSTSGICVVGAQGSSGQPTSSPPVSDVTIANLRVTGFSEDGIFGINTKGLRVSQVRADHNGDYGIARFQSTDSTFEDNLVSYNGEAGLYLGDSPNANSVVRGNSADHNGFGIFLRDSTHITAVDNRVWGNCVGVALLNSGQGAAGDQPAGEYRILDNVVWANDRACPAGEHPPFSGVGIGLLGVTSTHVRDNAVLDNRPTGDSVGSGGIVLVSTAVSGGADPTYNTVRDNDVRRNQPADITSDGTGTGNRVFDNECLTAIPDDLGWCGGH